MPLWIIIVGWITKLVFAILIGLSIYSFAVILDRRKKLKLCDDVEWGHEALKKIKAAGANFESLKSLKTEASAAEGLRANLLSRIFEWREVNPSQIDRMYHAWALSRRAELDKGFTALATLGNNAPFIGLFGTVLGIIQAFGVLSSSQGGTNTVMSGIAEALIATAIGIFVAIPSVVAFNIFNRKVRDMLNDSEILKDSVLFFVKKDS